MPSALLRRPQAAFPLPHPPPAAESPSLANDRGSLFFFDSKPRAASGDPERGSRGMCRWPLTALRKAVGIHSALTDCTVQFVGMMPIPAVEAIVAPFMNHIAVLPPVSRQRRSLMPSPL
jgi:hypothetical protein